MRLTCLVLLAVGLIGRVAAAEVGGGGLDALGSCATNSSCHHAKKNPFLSYPVPCSSQKICCQIYSYRVPIEGWDINLYSSILQTLTMLSVVFLLFSLRPAALGGNAPATYFYVLMVAAVVFFFTAMIHMMPSTGTRGYETFHGVIIVISNAAEWLVQLDIVLFMFCREPTVVNARWTFLRAGLLCVAGVALWMTIDKLGCAYCGALTQQALLWMFFSSCFVLAVLPRRIQHRFLRRPRAHAAVLSAFLALVYCGLSLATLMTVTFDRHGEFWPCVTVTTDLLYFCLFAALLWWTLAQDLAHWREASGESSEHLSAEEGRALLINDPQVKEAASEPTKAPGAASIVDELSRLSAGVRRIRSADIEWNKLIGVGQYGEVYLGTWHATKVAVKKFKLQGKETESILAEMIKETAIMAQLRHPSILQIMGVILETKNTPEGDSAALVAIVMEYMARGSIFNILHRTNLERDDNCVLDGRWDLVVKLARDTARGMLYLHSCEPPILYRDAKSMNVLVDEQFNARLADFGLARTKSASFTMTTVGTPAWMSGEVLRGEHYDESADMFSFGVILWELITKMMPWYQIQPVRVVSMVAFQRLRLALPTGPAPLVAIVAECFAEDPRLRPTAAAVVKRLDGLTSSTIRSWDERYGLLPSAAATAPASAGDG